MELKFCCAWLYAISKYNKYADIFEIIDLLIALKQIEKLGFDRIELEVMRKKNLEEIYNNKKLILENLEILSLKVNNLCAVFPELMTTEWKNILTYSKNQLIWQYILDVIQFK